MLANIHSQTKKKMRIILILAMLQVSGILSAQPLTLEQCIDTALQYNRTIKLSQQDVFLANEKNKETKGNLFPKLNAMTAPGKQPDFGRPRVATTPRSTRRGTR